MAPNSFGSWYKKNYNSEKFDAPDNAWQNISAQLDLKASQKKNRVGIIYFSVGFLLITSFAYLFFNKNQQLYTPLKIEKYHSFISQHNDSDFSFLYPTKTEEQTIASKGFLEKNSFLISSNSVKNKSTLNNDVALKPILFSAISLPKKSAQAIYFALPEFDLFAATNTLYAENKTTKNKPTNLWIGAGYHFNQSTLINNTFNQGLSAYSLTVLQNFKSQNFSALIGYNLNEKLSLASQIHFNNVIGQKYAKYIEGNFTTKTIEIEQTSVTLSLRKNLSSNNKRLPLFASAGFYASKISSVTEHQSESVKSLTENYRTFDFGIFTGLSTEIALNKNMVLVPQTELNVGALNLFKGTSFEPSHFNQTRPLLFKTGVGLKISL